MKPTKIFHLVYNTFYIDVTKKGYQTEYIDIRPLASFSLEVLHEGQKYLFFFDKEIKQSKALEYAVNSTAFFGNVDINSLEHKFNNLS